MSWEIRLRQRAVIPASLFHSSGDSQAGAGPQRKAPGTHRVFHSKLGLKGPLRKCSEMGIRRVAKNTAPYNTQYNSQQAKRRISFTRKITLKKKEKEDTRSTRRFNRSYYVFISACKDTAIAVVHCCKLKRERGRETERHRQREPD